MASENNWEPAWVGQESLEWTTVPGTRVSLQIQRGWPLAIMRAFAADFNAFVEPLRDDDSACYTPTNSVSTSNHLNGTAMDLNWNSHPFQILNAGFTSEQINTIRDLLDFYEETIWWGNDWNTPRDAMHFQMGYDTFNNPHTGDFIARKLRSDGFSMFRRGSEGETGTVDVLARAIDVSTARAAEILPTVQDGLRLSECLNVNRIAMWLAQVGHESAGFNATEEYQSGDESTDRWKYKGRTWIQITWSYNYAAFSQWACGLGLVSSPTYFVDNPTELAELRWAGIGPAWYWTVARAQINSMCDVDDLEGVTRAINGGTNGLPDRRDRLAQAKTLGSDLLQLLDSEDDMFTDDDRNLLKQIAEIRRESLSPLRHDDEGPVNTCAGFAWSADGLTHPQFVFMAAKLGHADSIQLLAEVSTITDGARASDAALAKAMLAEIEATNPAVLQQYLAAKGN
jgi:putative chitinase